MKTFLKAIGYYNCITVNERLAYHITLIVQSVLVFFIMLYLFHFHYMPLVFVTVTVFLAQCISIILFRLRHFLFGKLVMSSSVMTMLYLLTFLFLEKNTCIHIYLLGIIPSLITLFSLENKVEKWILNSLIGINFIALILSEFISHPALLQLSDFEVRLFRLTTIFGVATILTSLFYLFLHQTSQDHKYLSEMAMTDTLTNIANRRIFVKEGKEMFSQAMNENEYFGLIIFDIDHFKAINDTYGHPVGDVILKELTNLVTTKIRQNDIFARIGGEEFAIIFKNTNSITLKMKSEEICKYIARMPFRVDANLTIKLTISIGAVNYSESISTFEEMFEIADKNLYKAKRNGRNQVNIKIV